MGQKRGQPDLPRICVDGGGLHCRDLVLAQGLANDIEPTGKRGIAKGPSPLLPRERRTDGRGQRFFGVAEFALRLGQGGGDGANRFTGAVHRPPPHLRGQS